MLYIIGAIILLAFVFVYCMATVSGWDSQEAEDKFGVRRS